ncbi:MAG: zf-HC2 domain-containing protein [Saprospiraceae bacterium]|nr:zf-HC2 domain-containing protein [Saprospiraceae bacterium]
MEELIWKYLDGECSPEEIKEVEDKLQSDTAFLKAYQSAESLDVRLKKGATIKASDFFIVQMKTRIHDELSQQKAPVILPLKWILFLVILGATGLYFAIQYSGEESSFLHLPVLDERVMTMVTWVTFSFLLLMIIDIGYKKIMQMRKFTGVFL